MTNLGLGQGAWRRLADTVDLIVDPAALVNHVLPNSQLSWERPDGDHPRIRGEHPGS